jgi:hypothetical protein
MANWSDFFIIDSRVRSLILSVQGFSLRIKPSKILARLKDFEFIGLAYALFDDTFAKLIDKYFYIFFVDIFANYAAVLNKRSFFKDQFLNGIFPQVILGFNDVD